MAERAAGRGLALQHLALAHKRHPEHGIELLFEEKIEGGRRVTASKKIISAVRNYLDKL